VLRSACEISVGAGAGGDASLGDMDLGEGRAYREPRKLVATPGMLKRARAARGGVLVVQQRAEVLGDDVVERRRSLERTDVTTLLEDLHAAPRDLGRHRSQHLRR
jgi:hypothetical protein